MGMTSTVLFLQQSFTDGLPHRLTSDSAWQTLCRSDAIWRKKILFCHNDAQLVRKGLFLCMCCLMYSALRKYSAHLNFATFCHISGFKHKDIKLYFLWRINNKWDTIKKLNNIYWIFQTFLTNQKLKNWACKIIQPLYFQCSKLSPEVQWGSLNDPMLT